MTSLAGAHVSGREQGGIAAAVLTVAVVVLFFASLAIGRSGLGVLSLLSRAAGEDAETIAIILREIRLPRAILGVLVGGALGLAGAALQGLLRNPLAEPGLIGARFRSRAVTAAVKLLRAMPARIRVSTPPSRPAIA